MTLEETLAQLESKSDPAVLARNARNGAGKKQYGVRLGDIRAVAKKIKKDQKLALALWKTGNVDARLLATLVIEPKDLTAKQLDKLVRDARFPQLADWLNSYVVRAHPEKEALRERWMEDDHPMAARAGWSLTSERVGKDPKGLDLPTLLDRIEAEMPDADPAAQWTMNFVLAGIGIHVPKLRKRAVAIGEKLGLYRDYPVSKGCTSPFAPIWIAEMVKRQGK
ncbi:MAG: DNA alkylation repair protein [Planctomycetota bacterium]